ncbi:hypothetical protein ACVWWI_006452 [Bradyrhizobium sp. USDA 3686]
MPVTVLHSRATDVLISDLCREPVGATIASSPQSGIANLARCAMVACCGSGRAGAQEPRANGSERRSRKSPQPSPLGARGHPWPAVRKPELPGRTWSCCDGSAGFFFSLTLDRDLFILRHPHGMSSRPSRAVAIVFSSYFGMDVANCAIHDILCQDGVGLTRSKAPAVNINLMSFSTVDQLFQTSAFEAESRPPLVKGVSTAAQASWPHKAIAIAVQPPVRSWPDRNRANQSRARFRAGCSQHPAACSPPACAPSAGLALPARR